jgi:hypothetical protein
MTDSGTEIDWSLTTWEGSRRAQLRRWCKLSLRERLRAVEEMVDLARHFADMRAQGRFRDLSSAPGAGASGAPREQLGESRPAAGGVREQPGKYDAGTVPPKTHKPDKGSDDAEE